MLSTSWIRLKVRFLHFKYSHSQGCVLRTTYKSHPDLKNQPFLLLLREETIITYPEIKNNNHEDVPGGPVDKSPPASAGDLGLSPGLGRLLVPWGF